MVKEKYGEQNKLGNIQSSKEIILHQNNLGQLGSNIKTQQFIANKNYLSEVNQKKYGLISMFRFADKTDWLLIGIGGIFSLLTGASISIFALLWGNNIDSFKSADVLVQQTHDTLLNFVYIGIGILFFGWIMVSCWNKAGERQSIKCKNKYLECLLSQEVGWFQCSNQFQISSSYAVDSDIYQNALSHNVAFFLYVLGMAISGLVISFVKGWLMTLVIIGVLPLIVLSKYTYSRFVQTKDKKEQKFYSEAGGRAQQALLSIKTVKMLNGENYELEKYKKCLDGSKKDSTKFFMLFGLTFGSAFFFILCTFSFGLWYGSQCIRKSSGCSQSVAGQDYTAGIAFTVFFSILTTSFHLSHLPHNIKKLMNGMAAAQRIFRVIDREPRIKNPKNGVKIENFRGIIKFKNVSFSYPKEPTKLILNDLNLEINKKKIAFVGESGCGKSTIIQLIMRFYDPDIGQITVDGVNLKDIDLVWWRQEMIGYVGQEPVLFATTIRQNLIFSASNSTQQQLTEALRKAKVLEFVQSLEKKMDTYVGSGGSQVSGGQKQRIAIARAIVRKPKMLILDQATSALDRKTEKQIQHTLNEISSDVMSLTIAHRTKTIMNSDQIFVIEKGKLKESGRFEELQRFKNAPLQYEKEDQHEQEQEQKRQENQEKLIQKIKQTKIQTNKQNKLSGRRSLLSFYKQSYFLLFLAFLATLFLGAAFPVSAIFLSNQLEQMLIPHNPNLETETNKNSLIILLIGVGLFLACLVQINLLEKVGQRILTKIRLQTYLKLLKLPVHWHENQQNNISSVTSTLSVGTVRIRQMTTMSVFYILEILLCMLIGLIIAFVYEWRMGLIQLAFFPINLITVGFSVKYRSGVNLGKKQEISTNGIINQAVTNIKTVYSLVYQKKILKNYSQLLTESLKINANRNIISGFFYGLGECLVYVLISVLYYIGSIFVRDYDVPVKNVFTVIFVLFFATVSIGQMATVLPNIRSCIESSKQIFKILDIKDEQQIQVEQKSKMIKDKPIEGDIIMKNIKFKYPSRSSYLFQDLNLKVEKGKKVGFVGYSGCGKSTIMAFLLRFHEPESGEILIDGINIKDYDIHFLRSQFGVVSQQPVVFNASFKENIEYNMKVSDEEIIEAARKVNVIEFINKYNENNPQIQFKRIINEDNMETAQSIIKQIPNFSQTHNINNFNRIVGVKGGSISGGQKQRLAIARAILRKPTILLLDEATSALDSQNEKKVVECLDKIMENKTTISIAHKLQTIMNSDIIHVFNRGIIVEEGTYGSLLEKKGYFYKLEKGIEIL